MKNVNRCIRLSALLAGLGLAACGGVDESEPATTDEVGTRDEALSLVYEADPYASLTEDQFVVPDEELASGTTYADASGNSVTTSTLLQSCNGILLKWHTSAGNRSACVGRPCKTNPNGTACSVRRNINRYFDKYVPALSVAYCESTLNPNATNGQYHGLYQLSQAIRDTFGIGDGYGIRANVRTAHSVKTQSGGWGPWACKPGWN